MKANVAHTQHALRQLLDKKMSVVAGAAAATNIAVTGITTDAELLSVVHHEAGAPVANLLAEAAITSDGNIQLTTTVTTGDTLVVEWLPAPSSLL